MGRISHHLRGKDYKKTHQRKLDEQRVLYLERREKEIQEQQYLDEIERLSSPFKSDWRSEIDSDKMDEINEGMTTSSLLSITLPATGDTDLSTTEITSADVFADGPYELNLDSGEGGTYPALVGASVKSSGSGTGSDGGFDVGSHVAFDGAGVNDGARWAIFQPVDSTSYDKMVFSIIRGNGSNGGEAPDDGSGEGLYLYYKMPDMQDYIAISRYPTANDLRDEISDITIVPVGNDTAGIQEYEVDIPSYARGPGARFLVYQFSSNDSQGDNYGITKVAFRRRTPLNVFVGLDDPEATNFIRTDPIMRGLSAQERRKKLGDMLDAGDEYLLKQLGMQGSIARPADTGNIRSWEQASQEANEVAQQKYQQDLATYEKAIAAHKQKSDELSKAVAAARAEYLKSGQTVAQRQQSYDKLQAAIKAGTDHARSTLRNPITKPEPPEPPAPPASKPQPKFTSKQLADIDKQIKDLQAQSEKSKQDAQNNMNMARLNAVVGGAAAGAALGLIGGAAIAAGLGGAALRAGSRVVKTGAGSPGARAYAKANPGKYNPFLSNKVNRYLRNSHEPQGQVISEKKLRSPKQVLNNKIPGYYDGKPAPLGFPDNPPPEMVNGMHPDLVDGKKVADRFNRLDPQSAQAMPPTGNPHIDKKVRAAAKKPK